MPLRITNLRMPVDAPEPELTGQIADRLGMLPSDIGSWRILRKSLDTRRRDRLEFVYSTWVDLPDPHSLVKLVNDETVRVVDPPRFHDPDPGAEPMAERPVVVGSGPAGLLAGYYLSLKGYRPLILERGQPVKLRVPAIREFDRGGRHDPENNYLFGEGGAGCFSDGKLTCRITGADVDWVLKQFVACGGRASLVYEHRPHLGSNKLPLICRNFRRRIEQLGGEYRFGCRMEGLDVRDGAVHGITTSGGLIRASHVVLAIGHSARDSYRMLFETGVRMQPTAFQLGLRIEQPQENVNRHTYGRNEYLELLGAADYVLKATGRRDVFSFCMCAGGVVIPSISEPGMFCSNGMSNSRHDTPFANSGLVATLGPAEFGSDHPLAGVELQRRWEAAAFEITGREYLAPVQRAQDFLNDRSPDPDACLTSSYPRGIRPASLSRVIPPAILAAIHDALPIMDRKWRGDFLKDATLTGPEMRGSSPVRIARDRDSFECPGFRGLYPVGEGAGYAGGIVTAAVDGLRAARRIVERFAPLESV